MSILKALKEQEKYNSIENRLIKLEEQNEKLLEKLEDIEIMLDFLDGSNRAVDELRAEIYEHLRIYYEMS